MSPSSTCPFPRPGSLIHLDSDGTWRWSYLSGVMRKDESSNAYTVDLLPGVRFKFHVAQEGVNHVVLDSTVPPGRVVLVRDPPLALESVRGDA